jgi:hypothetical protein
LTPVFYLKKSILSIKSFGLSWSYVYNI